MEYDYDYNNHRVVLSDTNSDLNGAQRLPGYSGSPGVRPNWPGTNPSNELEADPDAMREYASQLHQLASGIAESSELADARGAIDEVRAGPEHWTTPHWLQYNSREAAREVNNGVASKRPCSRTKKCSPR
jgi:hypothetical protein